MVEAEARNAAAANVESICPPPGLVPASQQHLEAPSVNDACRLDSMVTEKLQTIDKAKLSLEASAQIENSTNQFLHDFRNDANVQQELIRLSVHVIPHAMGESRQVVSLSRPRSSPIIFVDRS